MLRSVKIDFIYYSVQSSSLVHGKVHGGNTLKGVRIVLFMCFIFILPNQLTYIYTMIVIYTIVNRSSSCTILYGTYMHTLTSSN